MKEVREQFYEKFQIEEILEAVDIGEGQGDVVPVGVEFRDKPDPDAIFSFIQTALINQLEEVEKKIENYKHNENHICRFNDSPQKCECYYEGIKTAQTIIKSLKD